MKELIESALTEATGKRFEINSMKPARGGCINESSIVSDETHSSFAKINDRHFAEAFEAEAIALNELKDANCIKIPNPIATGSSHSKSVLILEYIETAPPQHRSWTRFGHELAAMHAIEFPYFGWTRDNRIGATPQCNARSSNWVDFFKTQRIERICELCASRGILLSGIEKLLSSIDTLFSNYTPHPSLLHGDLWSGNAAFDKEGAPFVFDPATYYGDRETDIAFTEFFGGFNSEFYNAYNERLPLDSGYTKRKKLYNLYHCLNHAYLFNGHYAEQSQSIIDHLNACA